MRILARVLVFTLVCGVTWPTSRWVMRSTSAQQPTTRDPSMIAIDDDNSDSGNYTTVTTTDDPPPPLPTPSQIPTIMQITSYFIGTSNGALNVSGQATVSETSGDMTYLWAVHQVAPDGTDLGTTYLDDQTTTTTPGQTSTASCSASYADPGSGASVTLLLYAIPNADANASVHQGSPAADPYMAFTIPATLSGN